jgi:DNA-binding SARP family transcriptional activator
MEAVYRIATDMGREKLIHMLAWAGLAQSHVSLGSPDAAAEALEHARAIHGGVGERTLDLQLQVIGGDLALLRGDGSAAEASYRRALGDSREGELATARVQAYLGVARAAAKAGEGERAVAHARMAVDLSRRGDLGSLLPVARLIEATVLVGTRMASSALPALREADRIFAAWSCPQGRALCAWMKARTLARGGARKVERALARALSLTTRQQHDVVPWLRAEAEWAVPLLVRALARHERRAERLLVSIGASAVEPLIVALQRREVRLPAVRALGAIGDARARRALQRFLRQGDPRVREAAARALRMVPLPSPPALRISMLGRFEVLRDGHATPDRAWTTQKAKALLKLLVLHRPAGLHQEQAIEWLWPEQERARGTASLKTAVKLVRRALEPGLEGTASRVLHREGPLLRFAAASVWVDLDEHASRLAEARAHASAGRVDRAIADLEQVQALYRGDLLDPEDRYEEWAKPMRERVQRAHLEGLVHLSHLRASRADHAGAAEAMRAVLAIDPVRESAYRDLMHYALLRGNRDEVFALYAQCASKLREELGVEPEPATGQLLDDARRLA